MSCRHVGQGKVKVLICSLTFWSSSSALCDPEIVCGEMKLAACKTRPDLWTVSCLGAESLAGEWI